MRNLNSPEPKPNKNTNPAVWDLVIHDMKKRNEMGTKKYGTPLQPFNGRNSLVDLFQEKLDEIVYTRQLIEEQKWVKLQLQRVLVLLAENQLQEKEGIIESVSLIESILDLFLK